MSSCYFWFSLVQISVNPYAKLLIDEIIFRYANKFIASLFTRLMGNITEQHSVKSARWPYCVFMTPKIEFLAYDVQCCRDSRTTVIRNFFFMHSLHFFCYFLCNDAFWHWDLPFASKTVICQFSLLQMFSLLFAFFVTFALVPLLSDIGVLPFTPKDEHDLISGILSLLAPTINLTCTLQLMVSETRQGNLIAASSPSPGKCLDTLPTKLSSFTKILMN